MESAPVTQPARRKPFTVPIIFAPIYVPVLFLAGALSIPWGYIQRSRQSRQEQRFAEQMKRSGRLMQWHEFKDAEANCTGTAIGEYLSMTGPFRLWWTPDDIPATSPHKWKWEHIAWMEPEFLPFFRWCYRRYTNPQSGMAQLVSVPREDRNHLKTILASSRFISTCSFRSLREDGS